MTNNSCDKPIKFWTPATYCIVVEGHLAESWSERLAGMRISIRKRLNQTTVTTLSGGLKDQAELLGVLKSLYDMHRPILKVEVVNDG